MPLLSRSTAFARVTTLASQRPVHGAFAWLHRNPKRIMDWRLRGKRRNPGEGRAAGKQGHTVQVSRSRFVEGEEGAAERELAVSSSKAPNDSQACASIKSNA
jgi:hypothetical protein